MDAAPEMQIKRWELNAIVIELIVLGGIAMGVAVGCLERFSMPARVPRDVLFGVGFAFLGLLQIPALSLLVRARRQHQVSTGSSVAWSFLSVFIYVAVSRLLQYALHW
jgi:Co/Zn/Cd efflux system component